MSLGRFIALVGIALLVMAFNIALSVVYMVVQSHLIDPGHDLAYYERHIQIAAPYCGLVAGIPLMFVAGMWVGLGKERRDALRSANLVWLAYALIDLGLLMLAGMTVRIAVFFAASFLTRLVAVRLGALSASLPMGWEDESSAPESLSPNVENS